MQMHVLMFLVPGHHQTAHSHANISGGIPPLSSEGLHSLSCRHYYRALLHRTSLYVAGSICLGIGQNPCVAGLSIFVAQNLQVLRNRTMSTGRGVVTLALELP